MAIFLSLIYNIPTVFTYCVSWRTNNKILSRHLRFCFYQSNKGVTYCYLQRQQHTNTRDIYIYIYAGHCNTAFNGNNKEYFSFFLQWDLVLTIWTITKIFQAKEHFKVPYFTVYSLNTKSICFLCGFSFSCMELYAKGNQRGLYTHTQTKLNITVKKKKGWNFA